MRASGFPLERKSDLVSISAICERAIVSKHDNLGRQSRIDEHTPSTVIGTVPCDIGSTLRDGLIRTHDRPFSQLEVATPTRAPRTDPM